MDLGLCRTLNWGGLPYGGTGPRAGSIPSWSPTLERFRPGSSPTLARSLCGLPEKLWQPHPVVSPHPPAGDPPRQWPLVRPFWRWEAVGRGGRARGGASSGVPWCPSHFLAQMRLRGWWWQLLVSRDVGERALTRLVLPSPLRALTPCRCSGHTVCALPRPIRCEGSLLLLTCFLRCSAQPGFELPPFGGSVRGTGRCPRGPEGQAGLLALRSEVLDQAVWA